jgi:hypothetical protein
MEKITEFHIKIFQPLNYPERKQKAEGAQRAGKKVNS